MGFSPGEFYSMADDAEYHWEGSPLRIRLWNHDESKVVLDLRLEDAKKARDQLNLLVDMLEEKTL